jgi:hypothetical protein
MKGTCRPRYAGGLAWCCIWPSSRTVVDLAELIRGISLPPGAIRPDAVGTF